MSESRNTRTKQGKKHYKPKAISQKKKNIINQIQLDT